MNVLIMSETRDKTCKLSLLLLRLVAKMKHIRTRYETSKRVRDEMRQRELEKKISTPNNRYTNYSLAD